MPVVSMIVGVVLIGLGMVGYGLSGGVSGTALIPAFFGVPMVVLGLLGRNPDRVRWTMHVAFVLMVIGLPGTLGSLPRALGMLGGGEGSLAIVMRALMGIVCLVFVVLGIRSFLQARKRRAAE